MLLLGVCEHTDTHQLLLVRSVSLCKPLPSPQSLFPVAPLQINKGRVQEPQQGRGIKVTCACPPTAANGNVTLQTCNDPQCAVNTCRPGGSISCKVTGLVTGDSQFSYVSAQPGGKAETCFLTSACRNVKTSTSQRSCAWPGGWDAAAGVGRGWAGGDSGAELGTLRGNPWSHRHSWGRGSSCWCPEQEACTAGRCPFRCAHVYGWGWTTLLGQPLALQQASALPCLPNSLLLKQIPVLPRFPSTLMVKVKAT